MKILSRVTVLDSVRGLAALLVFLFHVVGLAQTFHVWHEPLVIELVGMLGPLGTNLLLLLCGFWITVSLQKPGFELLPFLRNRLVRIYVPYVAVVLLCYAAWAVMPELAAGKGGWGLESTLSNLILLPGVFPDRPTLTVAWTLSYVVAAYLTIPFLVRLIGGGSSRRIALFIALISLPFLVIASGHVLAHRIAYIPLGCLLAEVYIAGQTEFFRQLRPSTLVAGVLVFLAARFELLAHRAQFAGSQTLFLLMLFGTGAAITMLAMSGAFRRAAAGEDAVDSPGLKMLQWVGQRGYSIYLFHGPVAKLVTMAVAANKQTGPLAMLLIVVSSAGLTLLVADLSHKWLETLTANWVSRKISPARQTAFATSL